MVHIVINNIFEYLRIYIFIKKMLLGSYNCNCAEKHIVQIVIVMNGLYSYIQLNFVI